jgi:hypothetical protein
MIRGPPRGRSPPGRFAGADRRVRGGQSFLSAATAASASAPRASESRKFTTHALAMPPLRHHRPSPQLVLPGCSCYVRTFGWEGGPRCAAASASRRSPGPPVHHRASAQQHAAPCICPITSAAGPSLPVRHATRACGHPRPSRLSEWRRMAAAAARPPICPNRAERRPPPRSTDRASRMARRASAHFVRMARERLSGQGRGRPRPSHRPPRAIALPAQGDLPP